MIKKNPKQYYNWAIKNLNIKIKNSYYGNKLKIWKILIVLGFGMGVIQI